MTTTDTTTPARVDEQTSGTWTFYDNYAAFPFNSEIGRREERVYAEINVSLASKDGGTHGDFAVRWIKFDRQSDEAHARLEAFDDAFAVLARSGVVELLAGVDHDAGYLPDQFIADLEELGFRNNTETFRTAGPSLCPTCGTHEFEGARDVVAWRRRVAKD